jgi:hypothetical protein
MIHSVLTGIEAVWLKNSRTLPPVLFLQIDGAGDNVSKDTFAMCQLLVARGLFQKVVLSRLLVGHTHEDIDAMFGMIWTAFREAHIHTPTEFKSKFLKEFENHPIPVSLDDVFAVPDYANSLAGCIDPKFGKYAKEEYTQHQASILHIQINICI